MSKAGKITAAISGAFLLLIVVAIILIATFDWNRLKPTINQKVSAQLNRPFAIRPYPGWCGSGKNKKLAGAAGCAAHVHAEDMNSRQSTGYSRVTMVHLPRVVGNAGPAGAADQTVWLPWIKLKSPTRA
ncbi:AsmA family protein [Shigella flexneri]